MNLGESLRTISSALAEPDSVGGSAEMRRWNVLFGGRQRPLLVPIDDYRMQQQWLPVFVGNRLRALYARALLKLHSLAPRVNLLPEFRMPDVLESELLYRFPAASRAAIQIGTTGPYQKASVLLLSASGENLALAKFALAPGADPQVTAEAGWLRALEGIDDLAGQVPRLLAEGETVDGRRYLVTSLAPGVGVTTAFSRAHERFLGQLGRARMQIMNFNASPCCESLERSLAEMSRHLPREEAAQLGSALADCRRALTAYHGPFVLSQGDFAWWNIRTHPQGIFVFDWEYAATGANPLADVLHYHLIQRAASGRAIGRWYFASVLSRAWEFAQRTHGERKWPQREVSALALAYLLEVLLQYCRSRGGFDRTERVTKGYWSLMERRSTWMTA